MALKTFGLSVVIGGAIGSSFKSSFKSANSSLANMRNNIKGMERTKLAISSFKALSKDAKANKEELYRLSTSLKKAGIDIKYLDRDSRHFRLSLIKLKKASRIQIKIEGAKEQFAMQKASIVGIGASLYGLTSIVSSANNVLKSQGEIKSLGIAKAGIDSITQAAHKMSLQYGQITAPEFIKASYDIKSGIASLSDEGVKNMTKMASITAVATKSSTQEMTKLYALGYGIFRKDFTSDMDFGKKFSGAIAGAVQAFRTDGSDLSRGISNIGASAHAMGVSLEEELAIIGLSKGAFDSASEAGNGYRAFLDGTAKAQEKLGLNFKDASGKMLPMVEILQKIKDKYGDSLGSLDAQAELKEAFGSNEAVKIINALVNKTDALTTSQKNLKKAMDGGLSKSEQMAAAMDSGYGFEKMSNAMIYMSYTIGKAVAPAVDMLATALGSMAKGIAWLDEKVPALVPILSGLTFGFLGVVTVLKSYTLAKLGFSLATNTVKKAILLESGAHNINSLSLNRASIATALSTAKTKALALWSGILAAKTKVMILWTTRSAIAQKGAALASGGLRLAMAGVNLVMSANPIGLVVTALGALVGAAVWAYNKFDWFKNGVDKVWSFVKTIFKWSPMGLLVDGFGKAFDWLSSKFEWFGGAVEKMKGVASSVGSWFGFGDDEKESKKPANNHKFEPANAMKKVAVATAMTTQLAASTPVATNVPDTYKSVPQAQQNNSSNNTYNITVQVQSGDPKEIAHHVRRVVKEMESSRKNRSFEDEEI
jgi:TP901 family phage tail tape measure protein